MTFEALTKVDKNAPVRCADGSMGLVIGFEKKAESARVQVHGEPDARLIRAAALTDTGNSALVETASLIELEYIGPDGQHSALFGPLVVGQRYQAAVPFGSYLLEQHPNFWKRPDA